MSNDWKVFIEYRPGVMSTFIYVCRKIDERKAEYIIKGGEERKVIDLASAVQEDVHFARYEDDLIGSLIVEALDKRGIKAPSQSFIQGKYEATSEHLQDLRKLIPKLAPTNSDKDE